MSLKKFIESRKNLSSSLDHDDPDVVPFDDDILDQEYIDGVQKADPCHIPNMSNHFAWKRGFQNVFTGWPNDGKTEMFIFLSIVKSLQSGWKWVVWSPEMKSSNFVNGQVRVHYNDLINNIIWTITGKTPHEHISSKYKVDRVTIEEHRQAREFVKKHFLFLEPREKKPEDLYELLKKIYDSQGFDGILIDPFKNVEQDIRVRDDIFLEQLFAKFKDLAVRCNCVMNWIAHPKANVQRIRSVQGQEVLQPCDQYMLNGGAAWNNSMDGIYSVFRPNTLVDKRDPSVVFMNLKQRKQDLVAERGSVDNIVFDIKTRRYIFDQFDPIIRMNRGNSDQILA